MAAIWVWFERYSLNECKAVNIIFETFTELEKVSFLNENID